MVTLALEGPASYRDKYELVLRRQAQEPNAMWQSDHTMLDTLIVGVDGKPVRPWLTTILDDSSRAICGYTAFVGAPSAMNTSLALRQAIWHKTDPGWPMCGIPEVLYVDHGSDFTSDHLARTAIDLHIRLIHSAVARPQGRGKVERFFGTINTELLPTLPGHLRHDGSPPVPTMSLADLDTALEGFVSTYNHRTHSELGISPHTAWIAEGWMPRMPESLEELDALLLSVAQSRIVRRDGIHFQGLRYISTTLAGYVGRTVLIPATTPETSPKSVSSTTTSRIRPPIPPLGNDELLFVLQRHWRSLGKTLDPDDFTDAQTIAAIARVTRGNFRLLDRLIPQIQRVLKINELDTITNDVIEAAQSTLVIGIT